MAALNKELSMNEISAFRVDPADAAVERAGDSQSGNTTSDPVRRRIWDLPTRLFHWLLVACVAGAWLTAESETWRQVHVTLGYSVLLLLVFRVLWGFMGTRHARFSDFVVGPRRIAAHVAGLLKRQPEHVVGHNPLGAVAILLMLGLLLTTALSGWANHLDLGGHWLEELHEGLATGLLGVIGIHLAGVLVASLMERQNLVSAMITGRKRVPANIRAVPSRWVVAGVLALMVGGLWGWQWMASDGFGMRALQSAAVPAASSHRGEH
jgi:cytochrome b